MIGLKEQDKDQNTLSLTILEDETDSVDGECHEKHEE